MTSMVGDTTPMPSKKATPEEDAAQFEDPYVDAPIKLDYGTNCQYV